MPEDLNLQENEEIQEALKKFELKEKMEQMAQIPPAYQKMPDSTGMTNAVMRWSKGAIKEEKQAEYVLLAFTVITSIIAAILFMVATKTGIAKPTPTAKDSESMHLLVPQAIVK